MYQLNLGIDRFRKSDQKTFVVQLYCQTEQVKMFVCCFHLQVANAEAAKAAGAGHRWYEDLAELVKKAK